MSLSRKGMTMLKLKTLILEKFGPYRDETTLDIPEEGVTVVYGENMRGKTILLNAIRYALLGRVLARGEREVSLHEICNWESTAEGEYGFKVTLHFSVDDSEYELVRRLVPRVGVTSSESDADYIQDMHLLCNGDVLSPTDAVSTLGQLMPEKVSRFFLFDGELLQQYEELVREESDMSRKIKDAIDRILGVPVLQNARNDMAYLLEDARKKEAEAAQKKQGTEELGNFHAIKLEIRSKHVEEINRLSAEVAGLRERKSAVRRDLRKNERLRGLLEEREKFSQESDVLAKKIQERQAGVKDLMGDAWQGAVGKRIQALTKKVEQEATALEEEALAARMEEKLAAMLRKSLSDGRCQVCLQELPEETRGSIESRLEGEDAGGKAETVQAYDAARQRLSILRGFATVDVTSRISELRKGIDDLVVEKQKRDYRVSEIVEQTMNIDESQIRKLSSEHERVIREIGIVEKGIQEEKEKLARVEDDIAKVEQQLRRIGGHGLASERARRELCGGLSELFEEAIDIYRDHLREKVKNDATELFVKLTSEPDYTGLDINENYGLTIVHKDGQPIPVRSAGAEHIVALSLMGALQKNAPLRGPIIMDSPFGRLDRAHTTSVIQTLPDMAPQVVLLVYESELNSSLAREQLKGRLKAEYQIVRQTAKHSTIEARRGE
jgi:DNA sulfur modification protein DndD